MTFIRAVAAALTAAAGFAGVASAQIETEASHAVIMDYDTGLVLYSKNGEEPMPPSSMSKLMTMLMVFERLDDGSLKIDDEFTVSEDAWRRGGWASGSSNMCLKPKDRVKVSDLMRGVIVLSGNDACITIAENLAGTEEAFSAEMTERAHELGLDSANLINSTGWPDEGHVISAEDLAELARIIIRDHPKWYPIYSEREFGYCVDSPANRFNRNPLLSSFPGADGLKTGHTTSAGYGLVASAVKDGERRIVVFNGMKTQADRASEAERLMRSAFADFKVATVFEKGAIVGRAPVSLGAQADVPLVVIDPIVAGYHRRSAGKAVARVELDQGLRAPVAAGARVGKLVIEMPGAPAIEAPVVTGAAVAKKGLFARAGDALVHIVRTSDDAAGPASADDAS